MKFSNCCILFLFTLCTASQRIFYSQDFILHLAKCVFLCFYQFFNVHMVDSTVLCMLYPNSNGCFTHSFLPSFIYSSSWGLLLFIKCNISGSSCFTVVDLTAVHLFQHLSQPATVHSNVPAVSAPESNFSEPQPASVLTSFCFVSQKPYIYRIQIASIYHRIARS